ncbi:glycosyltransferase family 4 protein [Propionibacterium freudenreichii]|uniref:glycosyltransferase family 4 protein n=1 Tax=Propionibacterium freudenreichii TaxID=1744 RepID=UPI00254FDCC9|nr:glycosyltransferase family 4 protein [Propionibacterium freudenreichii]MDK9345689.1 glycosyltransferase family 4 protein [Propionibacterium freudenreichii]
MRVGLVCPYSFARPGGVQNHVLGLGGWLKEQGHDVSIIAPGQASRSLLAETGLVPSEFVSAGRAVPVTFNGSVARINFGVGPALKVKKWLDQGNLDVVHLHEPIAPTICLLALYLTDRPVTATFHTATPELTAIRFANRVLPRMVSRIDAAIAVSSEAADVAHHYSGVNPVVIGNGIHLADYPLVRATSRWRGGEHPLITFLGRYDEPRKGFEVLTAALPLVRATYPDLEVVVIGSGTARSVEGVRFLGGLDDEERNAWLGRSDIYIAPQTGRESFGIVLLEAMACGAPVVAANLRAFLDVLTDDEGLVGHTFRVGNSASASRAMLRSLSEPRDLRLERGRALAANYDWSVIGPQVVAMYTVAGQNYATSRGIKNRELKGH